MNSPTFRCLYCDRDKPSSESTVEHAIPQFLGGAYAPAHYRLKNVCKRCNDILGLHVDASYARSWQITNSLTLAARKLYRGPDVDPVPLPLVCLGPVSNVPALNVPEGHIAEFWAGPSGEAIVWIRAKNEAMYWYTGGNPIDKKRLASTLYFMPTADDEQRFIMGMDAFLDYFKNAVRARRILCASISNAPPGAMLRGFDAPTTDDQANIAALREAISKGSLRGQLAINLRFDERFICKLVLGIGYALFGQPFLESEASSQARLGLWPHTATEGLLRGTSSWDERKDGLSKLSGYPGALAILVLPVDDCYVLSVNVDQEMPFTVELAPRTLESKHVGPHGYSLLLWPQLRRSLELPFPAMLAHKQSGRLHPELSKVDAFAQEASAFNASLPSRRRTG